MKKLKPLWLYAATITLLVCVTMFISGCTEDPEEEDPQDLIHHTWELGTSGYVKQDEVDVSSDYAGLTLTFNADGTYTTSNGNKLFHSSGTWAWQSSDASQFILYQGNSDVPVTVVEISGSVLHIRFNMQIEDVNANGKATAVVGSYELLLN